MYAVYYTILSKALNILGFPPFQTFELTTYQTICTAFLTQIMLVMKNRRQAVMEAKEYKSKKRKPKKTEEEEDINWRVEVVRINEAFQVFFQF